MNKDKMKKILLSAAVTLMIAGTSLPQNERMVLNSENFVEVNLKNRNSLKPINEVCPIEGKKIDYKIPFLIFNNKIIGFCCNACIEVFNIDPQAHLKKFKSDAN
jgi:hypothetical protein